MSEPRSPSPVEIAGLSRRFGSKRALDSVDLVVSQGSVFGLVGENGAGKTTLIRHFLGLLAAQAGTVRLFGVDPVRDPAATLSRVGYLSEDRDLPGWMRIDELLRYTRAFYPKWDPRYAEELRRAFDLPPDAYVRTLSQGQRARVGLIVALAHRPELLILDEPSTGLDPIVRRDILGAVIRTVADDGRTVIFSSHLLDELEQVVDHVTMLEQGRVALDGTLDDIKDTHTRVVVRLDRAPARPLEIPGLHGTRGSGLEWSGVFQGTPAELERAIRSHGGWVAEQGPASLDEIFVARSGRRPPTAVLEVVP